MKKLFLLIATVTACLIFSSCNKDDEPTPEQTTQQEQEGKIIITNDATGGSEGTYSIIITNQSTMTQKTITLNSGYYKTLTMEPGVYYFYMTQTNGYNFYATEGSLIGTLVAGGTLRVYTSTL